jgi:hypothetical protein
MAVTMEGLSLSGAFNSLRAKYCSEHQPGVHQSPVFVGIYRRPDRVLFSLRISRRKLQTNAICDLHRTSFRVSRHGGRRAFCRKPVISCCLSHDRNLESVDVDNRTRCLFCGAQQRPSSSRRRRHTPTEIVVERRDIVERRDDRERRCSLEIAP